jgi:hypothetical protein
MSVLDQIKSWFGYTPTPSTTGSLKFFYIVPAGQPARAEADIIKAALHLQAWYRWQMGDRVFSLTNPIVKVCKSVYPAGWFSTHDPSTPSEHVDEIFW